METTPTTTNSTFTLFPSLPSELQDTIWLIALQTHLRTSPQIHTIAPNAIYHPDIWESPDLTPSPIPPQDQTHPNNDASLRLVLPHPLSRPAIPPLLHTTHASRLIALKAYTLLPLLPAPLAPACPPFPPVITRKTYVSLKHDTFFFPGHRNCTYWPLAPPPNANHNPSASLMFSHHTVSAPFLAQLAGIQHFAFDAALVFDLDHTHWADSFLNRLLPREFLVEPKTVTIVTRAQLFMGAWSTIDGLRDVRGISGGDGGGGDEDLEGSSSKRDSIAWLSSRFAQDYPSITSLEFKSGIGSRLMSRWKRDRENNNDGNGTRPDGVPADDGTGEQELWRWIQSTIDEERQDPRDGDGEGTLMTAF